MDAEALDLLAQTDQARPVVVACSGGADSIFLTLTAISLVARERIHVAHYHHGLRGPEADEDADFVRQVCQALGLQFHLGRRQAHADTSEAALRTDRYQWLVGCYHAENACALLLGHHADDLLETQLINLLTGSGPAGMCAPLPVHAFPDGHVRVRPLLPVKRAFIEQTLISLNAPWREDHSNLDTRYTRNWLRHELVPKLLERFPQDIHMGSARTARLQREALHALDTMANQMRIDLSNPCGFDAAPLLGCSAAVIRRTLYAWWMRHYGNELISTGAADKIVSSIGNKQLACAVSIGQLTATGEQVQCIQVGPDGRLALMPESKGGAPDWNAYCNWHWRAGPVYLPCGAELNGEEAAWPAGQHPFRGANPEIEAYLAPQTGPLCVRQWQNGDRYRPLGAPGTRKLQDLFCDSKLNSEQKRTLPVILNNKGEILWVPGFPPAEFAKVAADANSALRLTYRVHSTAFQ